MRIRRSNVAEGEFLGLLVTYHAIRQSGVSLGSDGLYLSLQGDFGRRREVTYNHVRGVHEEAGVLQIEM